MMFSENSRPTCFEFGPYFVTPSENGERITICASLPDPKGATLAFLVFGLLIAAEAALFTFLRRPAFPAFVRNGAALAPLLFSAYHMAQVGISLVRTRTAYVIDRASVTFSKNGEALAPLKEIAVVRWVQVFDWGGRGKTWVVALEKGGPSRYAHGRQFVLMPPLWAAPQEDEAKAFAKNVALYLGVSAAVETPRTRR